MFAQTEQNENQAIDWHSPVREIALAAKRASVAMAMTSNDARNKALGVMASALRNNTDKILEANALDMKQGRSSGMKESLLDRLMLDALRVESMACALEALMLLPDPLGVTQQQRTLQNGLELQRVSVPLGVVAMVYEARPNVTADAAGICVKTGNACVLRGGSAAEHSNAVIAGLLHDAVIQAGMPTNVITALASTDRAATDELMSLHGIVDVLIPRGGSGLIKHCVENSKVPVIETGTGNCHVYVEASADLSMAHAIVINAKCRRVGVCNAAETLLVDKEIATKFLPIIMADFAERGVLVHADETAFAIAKELNLEKVLKARTCDWETEYLDSEIAIKCVSNTKEAIDHINTYGTKHSEAIVTSNKKTAEYFAAAVDAAALYINASTAFTDGGEFGLGAEIGISTQKLHVRGPFALEALTSYKYILHGTGQVRA